ncbi:DUF4148 domain-containing protein [Paraburkholderia sp. SARCC-3016]|jgi:hypothetical protein|uniref:DUF4148 domain-containing protein n=1 Tax=Paraburkholderia sp. SARCC-3016 TaxID=3058611 RepID=UPI00280A20A6|nr:DUF4148 domain-containing protein [Paraburkholderia sp. SARCC-3016]MDQ7977106.1 DUF4148 domain-containing protein [Paraburkholderia sp. SARCC-3016]
MKRLNKALIAASFVVLPLVGHAADNAPLTRAQVRADLISAEQNGTYPLSKVHYPDPGWNPSAVYVANKAAQKMAQQAANREASGADTSANASVAASSYGGSGFGSSAQGARFDSADLGRAYPVNLYRHH